MVAAELLGFDFCGDTRLPQRHEHNTKTRSKSKVDNASALLGATRSFHYATNTVKLKP
jgi:hypothetical protein